MEVEYPHSDGDMMPDHRDWLRWRTARDVERLYVPPTRAIDVAGPAVSGSIITGRGLWKGLQLRETAGAAAAVRLWDNGSAASGSKLWATNVLANNNATALVPDRGVIFERGIFLEVVSGTVEGVVLVVELDPERYDTIGQVFDGDYHHLLSHHRHGEHGHGG